MTSAALWQAGPRRELRVRLSGGTPVPGRPRCGRDTNAAVPTRPSAFTTRRGHPITRLQPGTLVGEYQIADRIARVEWHGVQRGPSHYRQEVAIKVLSGKLAKNSNAIRRFVLEARASTTSAPGAGGHFLLRPAHRRRPYYVMEFLDDVAWRRVAHAPATDSVRHLPDVHGRGACVVGRACPRDRSSRSQARQCHSDPSGKRSAAKVKLVISPGQAAGAESGQTRWAAPAVGVNVGTPHYMSPSMPRRQRRCAIRPVRLGRDVLRDGDRPAPSTDRRRSISAAHVEWFPACRVGCPGRVSRNWCAHHETAGQAP